MYDNELIYKLSASDLSFEDLPYIKAFICYLESCVLICEKQEELKRNKVKVPRRIGTKKEKKIEIEEDKKEEEEEVKIPKKKTF